MIAPAQHAPLVALIEGHKVITVTKASLNWGERWWIHDGNRGKQVWRGCDARSCASMMNASLQPTDFQQALLEAGSLLITRVASTLDSRLQSRPHSDGLASAETTDNQVAV